VISIHLSTADARTRCGLAITEHVETSIRRSRVTCARCQQPERKCKACERNRYQAKQGRH
jgi:hypothetical protein